MPIQQLASDVAAKIAAGEVIERPASVVKELVENALDAGATHIRVELQSGGLQMIRVADDGSGIPSAELPLAFARHATSKIASLADLERVRSLGFRGEALASVAAVARVTLLSRPHGVELGAQLSVDEGQIGPITPAGAVVGTSVTVRDLFASVPARLKFLKTRATEAGRAIQVVEQYALAYPAVRFTVQSEGRQVFATPGDGKLFSVLIALYGLSVAEQMISLSPEQKTAPADDPTGEEVSASSSVLRHFSAESRQSASERPQVAGYISRPSCYKSTRHYLSFFVNQRWVQSRTLSYAVEEAYHSLLLTGRHPIAVIIITLDPTLLDVNVHPAKTEVKFLHERMIYAVVQRAVRAALLAIAEAPEVSPRAFGVPAWNTGTDAANWGISASASNVEGTDNPSATDDAASSMLPTQQRLTLPSASNATPEQLPFRGAAGGFAVPGSAADEPVGGKKLPVLRVLGQVSQSYIITEGPDGVYMVDQHAAHERILLELMIAEWRTKAVSSQLLLQPVPVELSIAELEAVEDHLAALQRIGFDIEVFGENAVLVRALPGALANQTRPQPLRELLLELVGADKEAASHGETWEEHALANVACKAAIKAGQTLAPEEQRELIRQLEGADARQSCCHGRPTMVHISLSALERQFDRR